MKFKHDCCVYRQILKTSHVIFLYLYFIFKKKNQKHLTGSLKNLYTVKNMFGMAGFTTSCCHLAIFLPFFFLCVIFITDQFVYQSFLYILINYFSIFIVSVLLLILFNLIFFFLLFFN